MTNHPLGQEAACGATVACPAWALGFILGCGRTSGPQRRSLP